MNFRPKTASALSMDLGEERKSGDSATPQRRNPTRSTKAPLRRAFHLGKQDYDLHSIPARIGNSPEKYSYDRTPLSTVKEQPKVGFYNYGSPRSSLESEGDQASVSKSPNSRRYEYDALGNVATAAGGDRNDLQLRFSTKNGNEETEFHYYGYRYYDPVTGRWPSRDPIAERGGNNLYGFVENNGLNAIDGFGLEESSIAGLASKWVVVSKPPADEFDKGNNGYGGFMWARYWIWSISGKVKNTGVAVSADSRGHISEWKGVYDYAYVYFKCEDDGKIVVSDLENGGSSSEGTTSSFAFIDDISYPDKYSAEVKFSAGASYKGDVQIAGGLGGILGGTVSFSAGVSGKSEKGQGSFKCICVYAKRGEDMYTDG